jgi:hypothetical protein
MLKKSFVSGHGFSHAKMLSFEGALAPGFLFRAPIWLFRSLQAVPQVSCFVCGFAAELR